MKHPLLLRWRKGDKAFKLVDAGGRVIVKDCTDFLQRHLISKLSLKQWLKDRRHPKAANIKMGLVNLRRT